VNISLKVLGNGQIWDLRGILQEACQKTFEDIFSGRALGEMAQGRLEAKGKITGLSVSRALLSRNRQERFTAKKLLRCLAKNGAKGITALTRAEGFKPAWSHKERNYWKNLDVVIIGGGVSEGKTGQFLVNVIKRYLAKSNLAQIKVYQAKFPGKEAGFLGASINILKPICKEARENHLKRIACLGVDLGRQDIGVGLLAIDSHSAKVLRQNKDYWVFQYSVKTPHTRHLKNFKDSRLDYTLNERKLGIRIREAILEEIAGLIQKAHERTKKSGLKIAHNIGVAIPGNASKDGYIIDSTDHLPFFKKEDGFNFAKGLEKTLVKKGLEGYRANIINDGIAAGIANAYFSPAKIKKGKLAFLGVGSGLGGCVGRIVP